MERNVEQTYRELVEEFSDTVTQLCIVHTGNMCDAEDCYQNVFFKLYRELKKNSIPNPKAWILRVTVNECKSMLRYRLRRNTVNLEEVTAVAEDKHEFELLDAVYRLAPKYRDVIFLYYYQGLSIEEISDTTGIKINTVKSQLKRAREQLKDFLD